MSQQQPRNYLHGKQHQQQQGAPKTRVFTRQLPDSTMHHPPGAMFTIGILGILAGIGANLWQMVTSFSAFWNMFNPAGTPVDAGRQPMVFIICGLIAVSFQIALLMLVFRIDTTWKKHRVTGNSPMKNAAHQIRATAIEIVQHVNIMMIWGALSFIVLTIGDYTFISVYTANIDAVTGVFIIFCYAVALYALSTIALVRSIEFLWAGFAAADNIKRERGRQS